MCGKGERASERKLLPFRCSFGKMPLPYLRHEAAHLFRGSSLHLPCDVGVGAEGEARVVVPEHTADGFHIYAVFQCQGRDCVPLLYNCDTPEKPSTSRVCGYLARFVILFQTEKSSSEVVIE